MSGPIPELLSVLLSRELSRTDVIESVGEAESGQLSVMLDGKLLSPRETRKFIISIYEEDLGRKLSKKEQNLAMQTVRKALSKSTPEVEEVVLNQITGRPAIMKGGRTWGDDA